MTNLYTMKQYELDGGDKKYPLHSVVISDNNLKHFFYCHREWQFDKLVCVFSVDVFIPFLNSCYRYYWKDNGTMELFAYDSDNDKFKPCVFVISENQANKIRMFHEYAQKINQYIAK
jgi:hypothetical protein